MALWLPMQGYAAVVMPFCQHSLAGNQSHAGHEGTAAQPHEGHTHHHAENSGAGTPQAHTGHASGLACNDCGACHLACSPAIAAAVTLQVRVEASVYEPVPAVTVHLFYPEQPLHPPLTAFL